MSCSDRPSDDVQPLSAVARGDLGEIRAYARSNPGYLTASDERGFTPVVDAVVLGRVDSFAVLCELGADLSAVSINDRTLTLPYMAAYFGHLEMIEALYKAGVDLNASSINGRTPLSVAACTGRIETLRLLHTLGVDMHYRDDGLRSPLHMAAVFGHVEAIRLLHDLGLSISAADVDGNTPVHASVTFGRTNMTRWLQDLGEGFAPPLITKIDGGDSIVDSPESDHVACLRLLHELGASITTPENNGCTPVYMAAAAGQVDSLRALHELGADISTAANAGDTPVYAAAYNGHADAIRVLHELGADISVAAENGDNPVCAAAFNGHPDAIRTLYELGADLTVRSHNGDTAVCSAAFNGHVGAIRVLRELGADLTTPGNGRCTPLHMAAWKGFVDCFRYLIDAGVDTRHLSRTAFEFQEIMAAINEVRCACAMLPGNEIERYELHSLVKLATGTHIGIQVYGEHHPIDSEEMGLLMSNCAATVGVDASTDSIACVDERATFEADLATYFTTHRIHMNSFRKMSYTRRCHLMELSSHVFHAMVERHERRRGGEKDVHQEALLLGELMELFLCPDVLKDLLSLRMTCKCCEVERRFPMPMPMPGPMTPVSATYTNISANTVIHQSVLEVHLIEQFIGGEISYYVSTTDIKQALNLHGVFQQSEALMDIFT